MAVNCGNGGLLSKLFWIGVGVAGTIGVLYIASPGCGEGAVKKAAYEIVKTEDGAKFGYEICKATADANVGALVSAMSDDYKTDREGMGNIVKACTGLVDVEKAHKKAEYAKMPVVKGSADPNQMSCIDTKVVNGERLAVVRNDSQGVDYVVTHTEMFGQQTFGFLQLPTGEQAMQKYVQKLKSMF